MHGCFKWSKNYPFLLSTPYIVNGESMFSSIVSNLRKNMNIINWMVVLNGSSTLAIHILIRLEVSYVYIKLSVINGYVLD